MGLRFRKTIALGKVFRINLTRRGVGASASIPGTGISYSVSPARKPADKTGTQARPGAPSAATPAATPATRGDLLSGCLIAGTILVVAPVGTLALFLWLILR